MSYAVIKSGGKQYRVSSGDVILIEKNTTEKGKEIQFKDVIMLGEGKNIKTKSSDLNSVSVIGEVLKQTRGPKITIFKKKRRHNYRRKKGHKQDFTLVRIKSIGSKEKKSDKKEIIKDKNDSKIEKIETKKIPKKQPTTKKTKTSVKASEE